MNQRINEDCNNVVSFSINVINDSIIQILSFFVSFIIMFTINPGIAFSMFGLGIIYLLLYLLLKKKIYYISMNLKEEQARFFSALLLQLEDVKFLQIHSLANVFQRKLKDSYSVFLKCVLKSQKFFYVYQSLDSIITTFANIVAFILGGISVLNHIMSIGEFTILISFFNNIIGCLKYFSNLGQEYQMNMASYHRLKEIQSKVIKKEGEKILKSITMIEAKNVTFARDNNIIIDKFSKVFECGKSYAIHGKNGRGKSTLVEVLIDLYNGEYTGELKYNGIDIRELNMYETRKRNISFMEQNTTLLEGTVDENIYLFEGILKQKVQNYINNFGALFGSVPSLGEITAAHAGISGGEKQKIAMLRALCKKADVLIMDEPTSALDTESINNFINCIQIEKKNKIVIIISHDKKVCESCDEIINI